MSATGWEQPDSPEKVAELSKLAGRFPGWECWNAVSGLLHARRKGTDDPLVTGEDETDLADQIRRAEALREG